MVETADAYRPPAVETLPREGVVDQSGRLRVLGILVWICIAAKLLETLAEVLFVTAGVAIDDLPVDDPRFLAVAVVGIVQLLAFLSFGITLLRVLARAHRNACAIKGLPLFHSRWGMIVWFWVPLMQLFKPFHAVREVWLTSTLPGRPTVEVPSSFSAWWGTWAAGIVIGGFAERFGATSAGVTVGMLAAIAYVIAAMEATSTVRKLNDVQTASAAEMQSR